MTEPRFTLAGAGHGAAIVDEAGAVVCFCAERGAASLVAFLNAIDPTREQLDVLLGEGAGRPLLKRIASLRSAAPCHRCGRLMPVGSPAWWHPATRLVRHGRCPAAASRRPRRKRAR